VTLFQCEGAWSAILRLPERRTDEEWAFELLEHAAVAIHPGHLFDIRTKSCVVVSLLPEPGEFSEGIQRLLAAVQ
jgi:alanine-synthesizing transaminase